jgi:GATA-binding protein, other eukaryote
MDLSPSSEAARRGVLDDTMFPAFGNDASAASPEMESPEQMQKNDPLGTQIWKLYSRAKTQLPNAERMENLTWRMMAMNMRKAEMDRNRGYECRHPRVPAYLVYRAPESCLLTFLFFLLDMLRVVAI